MPSPTAITRRTSTSSGGLAGPSAKAVLRNSGMDCRVLHSRGFDAEAILREAHLFKGERLDHASEDGRNRPGEFQLDDGVLRDLARGVARNKRGRVDASAAQAVIDCETNGSVVGHADP